MFPTVHIGPINFQTPGLIIIITLWVGLELSEWLANKRKFPVDKLNSLVLISLIAGVLGSRLSYAIINFSAFKNAYSDLYSLNPGLLDPFGGFAIGLLAGAIYGYRKGLKVWDTLDALTPLFATFMIGLNLANLASGNAFGLTTSLPWGINFLGSLRHPSQFYGIMAACLTLGIFWKDFSGTTKAGFIFLKFIMITSAWMIFLEGFRGDIQQLVLGIRDSQINAIIAFLVSALLYEIVIGDSKKRSKNDEVVLGQDNH